MAAWWAWFWSALQHPLWQYDASDGYSPIYRWINLLEGTIWIGVAGWVLWRWRRHCRKGVELAYASAFVLFGLSDFREAQSVEVWLIGVKGLILAGILLLRWQVIRRCYPTAKM